MNEFGRVLEHVINTFRLEAICPGLCETSSRMSRLNSSQTSGNCSALSFRRSAGVPIAASRGYVFVSVFISILSVTKCKSKKRKRMLSVFSGKKCAWAYKTLNEVYLAPPGNRPFQNHDKFIKKILVSQAWGRNLQSLSRI